MARDNLITTRESNLLHFDRDDIMSVMIEGESEYVVLCMRPDERALCLAAINFFVDYKNRWIGGWSELERLDLLGRANFALQKEMACSEDIELMNNTLASIASSLAEVSTKLGGETGDLNARLSAIETAITNLTGGVGDILDPTLIDQIEEYLAGIRAVLGVVAVL